MGLDFFPPLSFFLIFFLLGAETTIISFVGDENHSHPMAEIQYT